MLPQTQSSHLQKTFGTFYLLLILSFFLTQCGKSPKQASTATHRTEGGFALSLPSDLKKHQTGKNITAQLIIDSGTPIDMTVDLDNDQVTASTGPLNPGTHSFVIQYFLDGALIATATSEATIIAGQDTDIVFTPDLTVNVVPTVLATQPASDGTDVAVNSSVSATFSQPMDATSFIPLNFTLDGLAGPVAGAVAYSEASPDFETRFTPTQPLALAANYTANLSTGIAGILGEPLTAAHSWTFTTADGNWGSVEGVDFDSATDPVNNADAAQIAVDSNGNAIAVWQQSDGTRNNIWANRYVNGTGWGTPVSIEISNDGDAVSPQVAMDADGNAIAVWQQSDGTRNDIWANRFDITLGGTGDWEGEKRLEIGTGDALSPQVAMDSNGNAIAVWSQVEGFFTNIISNRFISGSDWVGPAVVDSASGAALSPQIAVDPNGNGIAVWVQFDGALSIFANRFDVGTSSWETAGSIEPDPGDACFRLSMTDPCPPPQVAMDKNGNAIAVWMQLDGSTFNIMSNHFLSGTGWNSSSLAIDTESADAFTPEIALDPEGNAFASWGQADGSGFHIFSRRFDSATGLWGIPTPLESSGAVVVAAPQIAFDPNGNAIAVWEQKDSIDVYINVWTSRYTPNTGWQTAQKLETEDLGGAGFPQIAVDSNGNAIAVWIQDDATTVNVQSNRFQ